MVPGNRRLPINLSGGKSHSTASNSVPSGRAKRKPSGVFPGELQKKPIAKLPGSALLGLIESFLKREEYDGTHRLIRQINRLELKKAESFAVAEKLFSLAEEEFSFLSKPGAGSETVKMASFFESNLQYYSLAAIP